MARVQMNRTTRLALYCLRVYLVALLALIIIRFLRVFG